MSAQDHVDPAVVDDLPELVQRVRLLDDLTKPGNEKLGVAVRVEVEHVQGVHWTAYERALRIAVQEIVNELKGRAA